MRSMRFFVVPLILTVASIEGCSVRPSDTRAAYEPVTDISSAATPMAQLPSAAGDVISVLQSRVGGVLIQRIVLKGDPQTGGENQIIVKVDQNPRRPGDIDGPVAKPTESMISGELGDDFTGIDMQFSLTWNRNSFGPFGYAIGHAAHGVTCIYAWQFSAGRPPRIIDDPAAVEAAASQPSAPTSVRVRLCKSALGEQEIVAMLRDLEVYAPGSTSPYNDPSYENAGTQGARDALAAAGVSSGYFLAPKSRTTQEATPRRAHAHGRVAHHRHHRDSGEQAFSPKSAPMAGSVNVPLPAPGPAPTDTSANPLLAPLQGAMRPRSSAAADDMPLPTPAKGLNAPRASDPAPAKPALAPMPLPN